MMYWQKVHHLDSRARQLADRHYSRQTIGAREICPPGNKIVLLGKNADALWVSHRPDPSAGIGRQDGFEYWNNPYFRNESREIASELILQALSITLYCWGYDIPRDGFHTFVNPKKVKPTYRHGEKIYGYCFLKAGFELYPEATKSRGLLRFIISRQQLLTIEKMEPFSYQMKMEI